MPNYQSAEAALSLINSGERIFLHGGAATPQRLVNALLSRHAELQNVEIVHMHTEGEALYAKPEYSKSFHVNSFFIAANLRPYVGRENVQYVPVFFSEIPALIRMAVGARSNDVMLQFLIEAIFLSFLGGIIGVGLGLAASGVVSGMMKWPVTISVNAIILSFACSTATGVFFGWYPARKAANLNPIEALRYE